MYEKRFYRNISRPGDLVCYEVTFKETDLFCCTKTDLKKIIEDRVIFYRRQLEEYIRARPSFLESLVPIKDDVFAPPIVRAMINAAYSVGVGPMASVAGAIAEFVGRDIEGVSEEYIIENGGDIFLRTFSHRTILVYAKDSPFSNRIGIKIVPSPTPRGVCTSSGTVGHSISFGVADAVCVVADSSLFADTLATRVGNSVKKKGDIDRAMEMARGFPGVHGILIITGTHMGLWGDLEITRV